MNNAEVLIGCDPELWLYSNKQQRVVPSFDLIGAGKNNPRPLKSGGAVLEDNASLEFNITPAATAEEFSRNVEFTLMDIQELLHGEYDFLYHSHHIFQPEDLLHYKAFEFGCDPDFNIYTEEANQPMEILGNDRFAGGHIHMSYNTHKLGDRSAHIRNLGMWADIYLGLATVLLSSKSLRNAYYGKAGNVRIRQYGDDYSGLEYRFPSNFWVQSPKYQTIMGANALKCMEVWLESPNKKVPIAGIPEIINTFDKKTAELRAKEFGVIL